MSERSSADESSSNADVRKTTLEYLEQIVFVRDTCGDQPWLNDAGDVTWGRTRIVLACYVLSQKFEMAIGLVILLNMGLIVYETDMEAQCYPEYKDCMKSCPFATDQIEWAVISNLTLLIVFTAEALLKGFVLRRKYLRSPWDLLDLFIVLTGWISEADLSPEGVNGSVLRSLRVVKLLRAIRILSAIRELYMLVSGLMSAMKAIFYGSLLLFAMLILFSVVLVQFAHPINSSIQYGPGCPRCPRGFRSVMDSVLTLFQTVIAGDSWGAIGVPLLEEQPWLALLLCTVVVTISLGVTNLILAVIVERAAEARESNTQEKLKEKLRAERDLKEKTETLFRQLDTDGNKKLSAQEVVEAYHNHKNFRDMCDLLNLHDQDLVKLIDGIDSTSSGAVDYEEFCDNIHGISTRDQKVMLALVKASVSIIERRLISLEKIMLRQSIDIRELVTTNCHQANMLKQHAHILKSMDEKLNRILASPHIEDAGCGIAHTGGAPGGPHLFNQKPSREPTMLPVQSFSPAICSEASVPLCTQIAPSEDLQNVLGQLKDLRLILVDMECVCDGIVVKAEEQTAGVAEQIGLLTSVNELLAPPRHVMVSNILPSESLNIVCERVNQLMVNLLQVRKAVRDADRLIGNDKTGLSGSGELLRSIRELAETAYPSPKMTAVAAV